MVIPNVCLNGKSMEMYRKELINYAYSLIRDRDLAEDLVQDSYLAYLENKRNEKVGIGWFKKVIKNKFLGQLRSPKSNTECVDFNNERYQRLISDRELPALHNKKQVQG